MARFLSVLAPLRYGARAQFRKLAPALVAVLLVAAGPARAETVTIAALGDSLTQGYGLPQEDGFVPQLESWLNAHGADVRLINAGVSGDTTAGGVSRLGWTLSDDVDGLIVALGGNDLLRGIDPKVSRANLETIVSTARDTGIAVLLVGMQAPGNYGPDYKAAFDANYPDLAKKYGTLLYPGFLQALSDLPDRAEAMADYMQADGLHPNAAGVKKIVAAMGPTVLDLVARARGDAQAARN